VPSSLDETDTTATESSQSPSAFIDALLHDTYLFVMQVQHSPSLHRDALFYRRGMQLVETMQRQLNALSASESFIDHVTYAQCGLLDDAVLNSAPATENQVWLNSPLQGVFVQSLNAGTVLPERLRDLLRQPAPDRRLLVLYQRIFTMGFGSHDHTNIAERQRLMEALDTLVPAFEQPLSSPLIEHYRPGARVTLLRSRWFWLTAAVVLTAALLFGLQFSLQQLLHLLKHPAL